MKKTEVQNEPKTLSVRQLGTVGRFGEDAAAEFLTEAGYTVTARNLKFGKREIDIIAEDEKYIVFVEVKSRTVTDYHGLDRYGGPKSAVTYEKRQNLVEAAREYVRQFKPRKCPRIDVIEVFVDSDDGTLSVNHINHLRSAVRAGK